MPSSSLWMSAGSLAVASFLSPVAAGSPSSKSGSYSLLEAWQGESFFDYFDFFDAPDPTNGYVTYVNKTSAESAGLINITSSGSVYVGVDHTSVLDPNGAGRESVRLDSKRFYEQGLYIVDIEHMPGSICGLWPAFWSVGPSWPEDGEIDIIEGVNTHENNEIVLHTSGTCTVTSDDMTGNLTSSECGEASGTIGCVVEAENGTYGTPLNKQGGGVYAMEWTTEFIKIWFFPRKAIPESITKGNPDPSTFGTPMGNMQGGCDVEKRFTAQKFILDTTFCGDWAGGVFGESGCPMSDSSSPIKSCVNYVAENPAVYKEAYWEINSIKVYQAGSKTDSSASMVPDSPASSLTATLDLSLGGDKTTSRPEKTSDTTEATFAFETTSKPETSVSQTAAARETTTAPDTTAPETTVPEPNLPKTTVTVTNAVRKTSAISEATTAFPETDVPETTAVPKTSAVDETTTAVPETDVPQASAVEPTPTYHHSATEIGGFQTTLKSTMYVTSRTTICPDAEASSFSTAGAGKTDSAATVTDTAAGTAAVSTPTETTTVPTSTVNVGKIVDIYPSVATSTPAAVISKSAENAATSLVDAPSEKIPAATATSGNSPSGVDGIAHSSAPSTSNAPATTYNHPDTGTSAWPDIPTQSISIHSVSVTSSWSAVPTQSNSVVTSARTSTPVLATGPSSSTDGSGPVFTGTASKLSFSILSAIAAVAAVILV